MRDTHAQKGALNLTSGYWRRGGRRMWRGARSLKDRAQEVRFVGADALRHGAPRRTTLPPSSMHTSPLHRAALLVCVLLVASAAHGQGFYLISKNQVFRQTSLTSVTPYPISPFELEIFAPIHVTVTLPSGGAAPLTLAYDSDDEGFIQEKAFPTKAALDAFLPPGSYTMSGVGIPALTFNLADLYPIATPQVTSVTNGSFNAGGLLVVNPNNSTTLNLSAFTDYAAGGAAGYMSVSIWGFSEQDDVFDQEIATVAGFDIPVQGAPFASVTIPANRFVNGRMYYVNISYQRVPTAEIGAAGHVASVLGKETGIMLYAQSGTNAPAIPTVSSSPASRTAAIGGSTTFNVAATVPGAAMGNNLVLIYKDGFEVDFSSPRIVRAPNGLSLTVNNLTIGDAGDYVFEIVGPGGVVRTTPATLTIPFVPSLPRLSNLSILTSLSAASDSFTVGYVVGGAGTSGAKPLVLRAAGPSLAALGVAGALEDPRLELFAGSTRTGENDNWGGGAPLATAMASVGAFAYAGPASRDAAVAASVTTADNSVRISGTGSGTVLAELYDATPADAFTATTPRLVNVSVLKNIGTGLTAGFVIGGTSMRTVLIRAIGPTLGSAPFSVPGVVADPQLALFSGPTRIAQNNDWGGALALSSAFTQVGAFALPNGSRDAAILATLAPGNYTVQVSPASGASGTALIEIYELP